MAHPADLALNLRDYLDAVQAEDDAEGMDDGECPEDCLCRYCWPHGVPAHLLLPVIAA